MGLIDFYSKNNVSLEFFRFFDTKTKSVFYKKNKKRISNRFNPYENK